ncbi:HAD family hydrolase [Salinivibrio kushneri]|uniref:HAD family hydrolase n=1 Tax=Salinivibrio kushneri TaxID=1908198 RepID=UPI0022B38EC3|nr:HAD-IIB family hydrolase [Salinivibrio kushneri]WBA18979.1 HAD-IIB family hydrolase [Salinivibrio kushneri]
MPNQCLPISSMHDHATRWRDVQWLFTDVDDTLTWQGELPWQTLKAMADLREAGIHVVPVTGACAGWGDHMINAWPVDTVISENGGVILWQENGQRFTKINQAARQQQAALVDWVNRLLQRYPDRALAVDQPYRLCEVAVDIGQHTSRASTDEINALLAEFHGQGINATASSIHINAWFGTHSKRRAAQAWLERYNVTGRQAQQRAAFIGDSPNDSDMFAHFPLSVGVANIAPHLPALTTAPTWITDAPGGFGFAEFTRQWLSVLSNQQGMSRAN